MRIRPWFALCVVPAFLFFVTGCVGKTAPATPADAAQAVPSGPNQLSSVEVKEDGGRTSVVVNGAQPMSPNIFKLTDPERIIVDLTNTQLGTLKTPLDVNSGGVGQITAEQFDDGASSLSRIVVGLTEPLEYEVESDRTQLKLKIARTAGTPPVSSAGIPEAPAISEPALEATLPPVAASEVSPAPETVPETAPVIEPPFEATPFIPAPAFTEPAAAEEKPASKLTDVQYSSGSNGTSVTLVANGQIKEYEDFVLKSPNRLVVDLKNLKNAYAGGKSVLLNTPEIKDVRLGKSDGKLRVVMDLASGEKPQYTIEHSGNSIVVAVSASIPATPETTAEAAPAAEIFPPQAEIPEVRSTTAVVTGLTFKQRKETNKSRIAIVLSEPVADYTSSEAAPGKLVIDVPNAKLEKSVLARQVDTREFHTAVTRITPRVNAKARSVKFTIEMDQQVPYNVVQEGNSIVVDIDIPAQVARKQTSTMADKGLSAEVPEAAPPPEEMAAPAETKAQEASVLSSDSSGMRREMMLEGERTSGSAARPRDYRYVKESFMSDSGVSGEPLSDMGAILAGDYRGRKFKGRKISLDFKDAEIRSIFRLLAEISKLNLIISDDVGGRVTVRLENVPWDQAFAIILQTKGLWFEKYGNIVRIAPADKLRAERELAAATAKAAQAAKPLDVLFKPVSYATAGDMMKQVRSVLTDRGSVDIDSRTNTLIIKDIRENLDKAKHLVDILDTMTPQVSVEARIVEASTNFTRSFGVVWGGQANFSSRTGNPTGVFFPNSVGLQGIGAGAGTASFGGLPVALNYPSPLGTNAGVGMKFGSINGVLDLDLALGLLETQGQAKLISSPKVTVQDNETANISAGSKIPFLTQTANAGSNVRFESATTSLDVTPHITNDGSVSMKITATRNEPNFSQLVQGNPLVDQRTASTKVLVKSGNTTVLGGIYSIRTGSTKDSLPGISSIPIIGWLFRNYSKELKRTELLIFVTPRIVGDEREAVKDVRG